MLTESSLSSGILGCKLQVPPGDAISNMDDEEGGLAIHDQENQLQWSIKFFENLHMDLNCSTRVHLNDAIERLGKTIFEKQFWKSQSSKSSLRPRTHEDPQWSPIVDVAFTDVRSEVGSSTPALVVVHRTAYHPGEQMVMGRFFLPVRRGLFEVIVVAGERGTGWRESSIVAEKCKNETMTADKLETMLRSFDFDSPEYDQQFPSHCLSRVREAMKWLVDDSELIVNELPMSTRENGTVVDLAQLRCQLVPPPRFVYCPNSENPESGKQRFCRACFGGTDGVQMMVVSCWYGVKIKRGIKALLKVARHGARVIHESQSFVNIHVSSEGICLSPRRRWLGGSNKDVIITVVDCEEAQGQRRQNTIGWIREPISGTIYLTYFVDTLGLDQAEVFKEAVDTLSSIGVPRVRPKNICSRHVWSALQLSSSGSREMSSGSFGTQTV